MKYLLLPAIVVLVIWTYDKPREAEVTVAPVSHAMPETQLQDCLDRADLRNQSNRAMGYKALQYLVERKRQDMEECRLRYGH